MSVVYKALLDNPPMTGAAAPTATSLDSPTSRPSPLAFRSTFYIIEGSPDSLLTRVMPSLGKATFSQPQPSTPQPNPPFRVGGTPAKRAE